MTELIIGDSAKKEAILEAALALFAERGFHGTAVPLIAERARIGAGTVYRYFESKEALVNFLYQMWKARLGEVLAVHFPHDAPFRQRFHELWRRLVKFARHHPTAFAFLERHHHAPYLDDTSRAMEAAIKEPLLQFVQEAQRQEVLKPLEPLFLIAMVYGAFVALMKSSWEYHVPLDDVALDEAENCLWEAVRR